MVRPVTTLTTKVVGLTFVDGYPTNLHNLATIHADTQRHALGWTDTPTGDGHVHATLIRNPDNQHDPNAIEVHIPTLGRRASMIGHIPRDLAARLAPSLDRGDDWQATVSAVLVDPEHPDRPGLEVTIQRVAETAA